MRRAASSVLAAVLALAGAAGPAPVSASPSCSVVPGVAMCFDGRTVTLTDIADDGRPVAADVSVGTFTSRTVNDRGYRSELRFDVANPSGMRVCVAASVIGAPPSTVSRICRSPGDQVPQNVV